MTLISRRSFLGTAGATFALAGCDLSFRGNGVNSRAAQQIDGRVDKTRDFLFRNFPGTQDLANRSAGVLFIPLVTEAGFGIGGAYGRGALRINGATVDYY
jgi:lipid-binding SYLF domain-containing protein